ncbi:MarR family transcriptional regulator [Streptomyces sp. ALI-76-A]|uniref:MarR family transcriptional regulator n=1 Tax=Streptomyces sp. ALI-76-A TaxID=3025736 RepID=UPI00256EF7B9|nr:MarR family transcriptional regulator [Streptomyces sp. ALI-76-A]MDL5203566.1 MarR family transcriptional regulator [Streptomyces sp. ALI-76-A]
MSASPGRCGSPDPRAAPSTSGTDSSSPRSPPAPRAPEALLLRSGRVGGEQWAELVRESGGSRWPAAGLVAHGYAGAAELKVLCVMALHDAAFAIAAGRADGCGGAPATEPFAQVAVGETPSRVLREAARRIAALAVLPHPAHPDRERPVPVPGTGGVPAAGGSSAPPTALRRALLAYADGRRTARDLAFRTGHGVYTVTVEVARMLAEGLLECPAEPPPVPAPRTLTDGQGVRPRTPPSPPGSHPSPVPSPPPASCPAADPATSSA